MANSKRKSDKKENKPADNPTNYYIVIVPDIGEPVVERFVTESLFLERLHEVHQLQHVGSFIGRIFPFVGHFVTATTPQNISNIGMLGKQYEVRNMNEVYINNAENIIDMEKGLYTGGKNS